MEYNLCYRGDKVQIVWEPMKHNYVMAEKSLVEFQVTARLEGIPDVLDPWSYVGTLVNNWFQNWLKERKELDE